MRYWWVNQNKTAKQEISGGYLWSPKKRSDGARNQFYENMRQVQVGDIIFSYYGTRIHYLGIATQTAVSEPMPTDFGSAGSDWQDRDDPDGWRVSIDWHKAPGPFRPKDIISELRPHLPTKYSPLQNNTGNGLQSVYLAAIPKPMADVLIRHLTEFGTAIQRLAISNVEEEVRIQHEEEQARVILNNTAIDTTTKKALIDARKGQGRFRRNLETIEPGCRVTGVTDRQLLRASHIKPWSECETNAERLDGYNGLLLTPTIDHLFDRGFISFEDDGRLKISERIAINQLMMIGIDPSSTRNVGPFTPKQTAYLAYHRSRIFR